MNNTAFAVNCKPEITVSRPVPRMVGLEEASHELDGISVRWLRLKFRSGELVGIRSSSSKLLSTKSGAKAPTVRKPKKLI